MATCNSIMESAFRNGKICANIAFFSIFPIVFFVLEGVITVCLIAVGQLETAKEVCIYLTYLSTVFLAAIGTSFIVCSSAMKVRHHGKEPLCQGTEDLVVGRQS